MGKVMMAIGFIIALGLLTYLFGNWEKGQLNPNRDLSSTTVGGEKIVTLQANRFHHYVATGAINGNEVTFLLDTGATIVAVPEGLADRLNLKKGSRHTVATANGEAIAYFTIIDELRLGPITLYDIPASINPGMAFGDEILLGMSALKDLEITQSNGELTLKQNF